jgi:tetratricopeptide (TPR) repeat protein
MTSNPGKSVGRQLMWAGLLVLLTLAAYVPAIFAGFIWDDDDYVVNNMLLRDPGGLRQIWFEVGSFFQYYPLTLTSLWVNYQTSGLSPLPYHLVNVLLHAGSAVILWRLLRRLGVPGAWLAAALFALHPVQVESVAWVTERKNVLSGVFYLAAGAAYLRFARLEDPSKGHGAIGWYGASLVLFVCALLSKTVVCSLPAVLLLVSWWKRGRTAKPELLRLIPFFAVGIAFAILTAWMEKHHVGAVGRVWTLSPLDRLLVAGRALCFYAGKLLWPTNLSFIYPRWRIDAAAPWQYLYPLAVLIILSGLWLFRRRIGLGPLVAVLCFAGTLVPALGFIDFYPMRYSFVADHFQYLASIFLIALIVAAASTLLNRVGRLTVETTVLIPALLLVVYASMTWRQGCVYRDLMTLWTDTLRKNPDCWLAHNNLGNELDRAGRGKEAMEHYQRARAIAPDFAETPLNIGISLANQGRPGEAVPYLEETLELESDNVKGRYNLGVVLMQLGRTDEAIPHLRRSVELRDDYADARHSLGVGLMLKGRLPEAVEHLQKAVELNPSFAQAQLNLGRALLAAERPADAIEPLRAAINLRPELAQAHESLAAALAGVGRTDEAVRSYHEALRMNVGLPKTRLGLARALAAAGRLDEAVGEYKQVLAVEPTNAEVHYAVGDILERQENDSEAAEAYRRALQANPAHVQARQRLDALLGRQ